MPRKEISMTSVVAFLRMGLHGIAIDLRAFGSAALAAVAVLAPLQANAQFTGPKVADARPGDVRVMVTAAIREPLDAVLKQAEAAIGKPIVAEYGSARG